MKKLFALLLAASAIGTAAAQTSVGVSIGINQPGVYGRINIGDIPRPALVLPQPIIIVPSQVAVERRPIYLYVPPAEHQDWGRYCGRYSACGQPVYFVQDQWVRERYQQEHPGWDRGHHRGWDKHDDRGEGRGKYKNKDKYKDKGKGKGKNKGKGHD